jgi:hypothetical protein
MRITCSLKKIVGRKIKLKATTLVAGTLLLSNRKGPFLIAPPNCAKTGTLPTRTQRIDVTNDTRLKEKERQARDLTPFSSPKSAAIVSAVNATGKPVHLQSSLFFSMKQPQGHEAASRSFIDDGMWDMVSKAKSSNPPLSKELFLQTHGQDGDCWEDDECQDGDHGHEQEKGDSSEESN